jgi:hypothetical protein
MRSPENSAATVQVAADRLYWANVRTSVRRPDPSEIAIEAERHLPIELESVQVVSAPGDDGAHVVCAIDRTELDSLVKLGATSVTPETIPDWVEASRTHSESLELLHGEYTPAAIRRANRLVRAMSLGAIIIATGAVCLGLLRDARLWNSAAAEQRALVNQLIDETLPPVGNQPPRLRLEHATRELQRATNTTLPLPESRDAGRSLAALVSGWPTIDGLLADSVTCTANEIRLRGQIPDAAAVRELELAFDAVDGWEAATPDFANGTFEIEFRRDEEDG